MVIKSVYKGIELEIRTNRIKSDSDIPSGRSLDDGAPSGRSADDGAPSGRSADDGAPSGRSADDGADLNIETGGTTTLQTARVELNTKRTARGDRLSSQSSRSGSGGPSSSSFNTGEGQRTVFSPSLRESVTPINNFDKIRINDVFSANGVDTDAIDEIIEKFNFNSNNAKQAFSRNTKFIDEKTMKELDTLKQDLNYINEFIEKYTSDNNTRKVKAFESLKKEVELEINNIKKSGKSLIEQQELQLKEIQKFPKLLTKLKEARGKRIALENESQLLKKSNEKIKKRKEELEQEKEELEQEKKKTRRRRSKIKRKKIMYVHKIHFLLDPKILQVPKGSVLIL